MSDAPSFNVLVWDSAQPERATRSRPNTRVPSLFPRVARQQPDPYPRPASSSPISFSSSHSSPTSLPRSGSYQSANAYTTVESRLTSSQTSLVEELGRFSSSEISDALVKLGLNHNAKKAPIQRGGYIPDIHMLSPSPSDMVGQNTRICGYAYTIKMVRGDDPLALPPSTPFIEGAPPGSVVVISAPPNVESAAWDGSMTARAQTRNVHGVVVGGRARDLIEHRASGFPVFAQGHSALGRFPFIHASKLNVPITILPRPDFENCFENTFAAVEIHPGDVIVADMDGVACVPPHLAQNVLDICRYLKQVNEKCMIDIQQGRSVQQTFHDWQR